MDQLCTTQSTSPTAALSPMVWVTYLIRAQKQRDAYTFSLPHSGANSNTKHCKLRKFLFLILGNRRKKCDSNHNVCVKDKLEGTTLLADSEITQKSSDSSARLCSALRIRKPHDDDV